MARRRRKSRRRRNGAGSVYRRASDGLFVAAVSIPGTRRRLVDYAETEPEAELLLEQLRTRARLQQNIRSTGLATVDSVLKGHITGREVEQTTKDDILRAWELHGAPTLGHTPIHTLKSSDIVDWLSAMLNSGVGAKTRQILFDAVRAAIRHAVKPLRLIPEDLTDGIPRPQAKAEEIDPFLPEDAVRIFEDRRGNRNELVYWLGFVVGMRQGEIFGLQWPDFDPSFRKVRIKRQVIEKNGKQIIRDKPKTKSGFRVIEIPEVVAEIIRERKRIAAEEGLAECLWVCPTENGRPWRRSNWAHRHWKPMLKRLGIEARGFHHARHSAATLMLQARISPHVVSRVIGHKKTSTTLDIYGHLLPGDQTEALTAVAGKIAPGATPLLQKSS